MHDVSERGGEEGSGATLINSSASATVTSAPTPEPEPLEASKHDFNQQLAI